MDREDSRRRGIACLVLALALFGATGYYDYDGLISLLVPASAFFVLVVAIVNLRRGGDEE